MCTCICIYICIPARFSEKSDVWAFGITAWEILTEGASPYFNIASNDDLIAHVCGGSRLKRDEMSIACHDTLWDIITSCWAHAATERPTFSSLLLQLGAALAPDPFILKVINRQFYSGGWKSPYEVEVCCTDTVAVLKRKLAVRESDVHIAKSLLIYTSKPLGACLVFANNLISSKTLQGR